MATFQKLLFAFLLWKVLNYIQAGDDYLSCSKPNITELGKSIMIKCKNNTPIDFMALKFCSLKGDNCSAKGFINKRNRTFIDGETTLKFHSNAVFLSIYPIKISHEGNYILGYVAEDGMGNQTICLKVFAPYTRPQIMKQEDMLICTASGGYPEEKLYWVSKTGTNLIHKATFQSVKNEDGSFSLNNTLQLLSVPSETKYCCILNHTRVPSRQPASACMTFENVTTSKSKTEETTPNTSGTTVIVIAVISLASILLAVMWWRKRRRIIFCKEKKIGIILAYPNLIAENMTSATE